MKINEDYLDDIEMNVSDDSKSDIDAAASEDAAALDLTFDALVNIKNYKKPEEWYFQKLSAMLRMFYGFLDKCPYIEEYLKSYEFIMYRGENVNYVTRSLDGVSITFYGKHTLMDEIQNRALRFTFSINANTNGIFRVQRLCLSLWNALANSMKKCFGSYGRAYYILKKSSTGNYKENTTFNDGSLYLLKNILEEGNERKAVEFYRAFHPELMPKQIKNMLAELRERRDSSDLTRQNMLNILTQHLWIHVKDMEIKDGVAYVTLEKDRYKIWYLDSLLKRIKEHPTPIPFVLKVKEVITNLNELLDEDPSVIPGNFLKLRKFLTTYTMGLETIIFNTLACEKLYNQYNGKLIDLTRMMPGYDVKFKMTDKSFTVWDNSCWYRGCETKEIPETFQVTIKGTNKKQTYDLVRIFKKFV